MATRKDPGGGKKPPRKPVTSVAKPKAKVTVSRGSKTAKQMGDMNAMENVRVNKYYKNIVSRAEVKGMKSEGKSMSKTFTNSRGEKFGANGSEVSRARQQQRAGGGKNLGPMEKPKSKAIKPGTAAENRSKANQMKSGPGAKLVKAKPIRKGSSGR